MTTVAPAAGLPVPNGFVSQAAGFSTDDAKPGIMSVPGAVGQMIGGIILTGM